MPSAEWWPLHSGPASTSVAGTPSATNCSAARRRAESWARPALVIAGDTAAGAAHATAADALAR